MARDIYGYYREDSVDARIGDVDRDKTREHLSWAFSHGYIDKEEFDIRSDRVNDAKIQRSLNKIVEDLPVYTPPVPYTRRVVNVRKKITGMHPSFKALSFLPLSVTMAIAVPISMLANHPNNPAIMTFIGVAAIAIGASTTILELIIAMAYADI